MLGLRLGAEALALHCFIVRHVLANEWLAETGSVLWTLRPGQAAQAPGHHLAQSTEPGGRPTTCGGGTGLRIVGPAAAGEAAVSADGRDG